MKEILDIFSKPLRMCETRKKEEIQKVLIDYREKNCLIPSKLISMGFEVEFQNLKIGDYIAKDVVIERKTVSDFISSIVNKRLVKQLEELKTYKKQLLIIEGIDEQDLYADNLDEFKDAGMHPNAIRGFLISILLNHQVPIIFTKNTEDSAKFISIILKRKSKEISLNVSKKNLSKNERLQFILEAFPGIGPKTAKKLLQEFKTLRNIFCLDQETLQEYLGKKADAFKFLDERY